MPDKKTISFVVVDLDNTLYDWFNFWHTSFSSMLDRLVVDSGVQRSTLVTEIKAIHQRHGTAEYSLLIQELPSLIAKHQGQDLTAEYAGAIHAYKEARQRTLKAYPGVRATLQTLKEYGCVIVGYTESMAFYTNDRIRRLDLDGLIDYLYTPPDHELPANTTPEQIRSNPPEHYLLKSTVQRTLSKGDKKPNPKVLLDIMKDIGATTENTAYVGDNLMKDVSMAQQAKVVDVWAQYGFSTEDERYELLREVTCWTDAEVATEKGMTRSKVNPQYTLENSFAELLTLFNFRPFQPGTLLSGKERIDHVLDIWKKTIDVQQHFNDLELRIRNYAVTVLAAVFSLAALGLKEQMEVTIWGRPTTLAVPLLVAGAIGWAAFYFMDRLWYHRLLYGAIKHGQRIEENYGHYLPELGLTGAIALESPLIIKKAGSFRITNEWKIRTPRKIDIFYGAMLALILIMIIFFYRTHKPPVETKPAPGATASVEVHPQRDSSHS